MQFYLSSSGFGDAVEKLKAFSAFGDRIGHIVNAQDQNGIVPGMKSVFQVREMELLSGLGFRAEVLDLRSYFGQMDQLSERLAQLDGVWISGGEYVCVAIGNEIEWF